MKKGGEKGALPETGKSQGAIRISKNKGNDDQAGHGSGRMKPKGKGNERGNFLKGGRRVALPVGGKILRGGGPRRELLLKRGKTAARAKKGGEKERSSPRKRGKGKGE